MKIYVGNIATETTEPELRKSFEEYGEVTSLAMIMDKDTGQPRGFAFVEMTANEDAQKAIAELNGKELAGNALKVNEAHNK